ncbi:MAG: hypothetical protein MUF03_14325 [Rubrivivax sp.]|jgi:hypothetical protein|nr:hypothetical protein [Rubrivivax sp.]
MTCGHPVAHRWLLAALLAAIAPAAAAQSAAGPGTVWRCDDGRVYSDAACRDGGVQLEVQDSRSAAEMQAARSLARREMALAARLAREREGREAATGGLAGFRTSSSVAAPSRSASRSEPPRRQVRLVRSGG